jgi:hypothetical protein
MSPDADDSCLRLLAVPDPEPARQLADELAEYRIDDKRFRLAKGQHRLLPSAHGVYLVWLPQKVRGKRARIENVDLGVTANILWFLAKYDLKNSPGFTETLTFMKEQLKENHFQNDSFLVSPYYPWPEVILFLLTRAIKWGGVTELEELGPEIIRQANACSSRNQLAEICLFSIGVWWKDDRLIKRYESVLDINRMKTSPFFLGHFGLGTTDFSFDLIARRRIAQFSYECEAFQWALLFWARQKHDEVNP